MPRAAAPTARVSSRSQAALNRLQKDLAPGSRRAAIAKADLIRSRLFKRQLDLITDPARFKTARCPRRAGKTFVATAYLVDVCERSPDANVLYITLTLKSAKKLLWLPLKRLNREFDLGLRFNNTDLQAFFPNGATLSLFGAETEADVEKSRGQTYDLIIVDECKSFSSRLLEYLITEVLMPALMDRAGTLALIGTPGSVLAGTFYESTGPDSSQILDLPTGTRWAKARPFNGRTAARWKGVEFEWSAHSWTIAENTGNKRLWKEALAMKRRAGWADDNPVWRREYLGEWVPDDGRRVYYFDAARNFWTPGEVTEDNVFGLPGNHAWRYVIGLDLGYSDPFALQIAAFAETCPTFYQVWEYERTKLTVSEIAGVINSAIERCGGEVDAIIADFGALGDTILATLQEEYGISVERASKKEKRDHIELLNGDLAPGEDKEPRCKILKDSRLADEWTLLQWDEKGEKEKSSLKNHNSDAFLYLVRKARHHFSVEPTIAPQPGSIEAEKARAADEVAQVMKRLRKTTEPDAEDPTAAQLDDDGFGWGDAGGQDTW